MQSGQLAFVPILKRRSSRCWPRPSHAPWGGPRSHTLQKARRTKMSAQQLAHLIRYLMELGK